MSDLIDVTQMYLRTILELEEEGVVPLRARIAERLHHSGPTVSQTVARMERDMLLTVRGDRRLELTSAGRREAVGVMRKHRLAELLLVRVIGLEYEAAHTEACRWEHVISTDVERKIYWLLGEPEFSPYGNRIPGLAELDDARLPDLPAHASPAVSLDAAPAGRAVVVQRLSEHLQTDIRLIHRLDTAGVRPGASVLVGRAGRDLTLTQEQHTMTISQSVAALIFIGMD
ncbi:metal-dependent transcriptional regulator [Micromonospora zamorensis]|uniref:metal-dependent transcriptional regulator n=1 Tax=Micromonospora zamorensis TaxID=709883 RepID=UPI0036BD4361